MHSLCGFHDTIRKTEANIPSVYIKSLAFALSVATLTPDIGRAQEADDDRWDVSAEFSFTDQGGNKDLRLLTGGLNASHLKREEYRLDGSVQTRYGRSEGELVALSHKANLAFDLSPEAALSPFLLADAERDEFKRLDVRLSTGAGAKYSFQRADDDETSLSLAALYSFERIAAPEPTASDPAPGFATSRHLARWSLRARTTQDLREGITLRHTTFYQPIWDQLADYLLRSETGLKVLLTERLALSADYEFRRDSRPPDGVGPNDRLFKTGIIFDF